MGVRSTPLQVRGLTLARRNAFLHTGRWGVIRPPRRFGLIELELRGKTSTSPSAVTRRCDWYPNLMSQVNPVTSEIRSMIQRSGFGFWAHNSAIVAVEPKFKIHRDPLIKRRRMTYFLFGKSRLTPRSMSGHPPPKITD